MNSPGAFDLALFGATGFTAMGENPLRRLTDAGISFSVIEEKR